MEEEEWELSRCHRTSEGCHMRSTEVHDLAREIEGGMDGASEKEEHETPTPGGRGLRGAKVW